MEVHEIIKILSGKRFLLSDEKLLQLEIEKIFISNNIKYEREYILDEKNRPDFFISGIAIEIKIKGGKKAIYKQCERYCKFNNVSSLILITNRSMGFPPEINGKNCYLINLGKSWL